MKQITDKDVARRLDNKNLSQKARNVIARTPYNNYAELFGDLDTEEKVEAFVEEYFGEEE